MIDACYVVRPGDDNEELRFSLRSIAENLPHRTAVLAGYEPSWADARHLPVTQAAGKHANALANLHAILDCNDLTPTVAVFNDDQFVMEPLDQLPILHRGYLAEAIRERSDGSPVHEALANTQNLLQDLGCHEPLCYDLHTPFLADRAELKRTLATIAAHTHDPARILWKTIHGNLWRYEGDYSPNVKVVDLEPRLFPTPLLSTVDLAFTHGAVGRHIRTAFPTPSRYEET